jgi:ribonuclease HII
MADGCICGVDEAGRGPIAGPVFAAAVVLDPERTIPGLADSKLLTETRRKSVAHAIRNSARAWSIAWATVEEVDRLNILQATLLAMRRAVEGLAFVPDEAWIDGDRCPELACRTRAFVGGDRLYAPISAASVLAKTARDSEMLTQHAQFPQYGFDRHKGYPTAEHIAALNRHGVCPIHRRSFAPVRRVLSASHSEAS